MPASAAVPAEMRHHDREDAIGRNAHILRRLGVLRYRRIAAPSRVR